MKLLHILAGDVESLRKNPIIFPAHFICELDIEEKKIFNPWSIQKYFAEAIGNTLVSIGTNSDSEFTIEISQESESNVLPTITELNFLE